MKPAKLHYFKGRGRAETTRWMLAINNIDFINISLEDYNDFEKIKAGFNRSRGVQFSLSELHRTRPTYSDYTTSSGKRKW